MYIYELAASVSNPLTKVTIFNNVLQKRSIYRI